MSHATTSKLYIDQTMHSGFRHRIKMFKLILLLVFLSNSILQSSCERSFTLALDTTKSMDTEILEVRANIGQLLNSINLSSYSNFVLVTFKDSAVEPIFTTSSLQEFLSHLNALRNSGGDDCPENSLAGIEAALRASEKQSTIFVFTDGYAKDADNFPTVEALCKETHSQVIIFLSGHCLPKSGSVGSVEVYYDIAKVCSGAMLRWESLVDFRESFRYMKEVINTDWTNVTSFERFTEYKQFPFSVDRFTSDIMMVVSGLSPFVEVVGSEVQNVRMEYVIRTRQPMVIRLKPEAGEYIANIRGQGLISVTFYERNSLPFEFGFSTKSPRSMRETSARPLAGWTNYLLIKVDESMSLREVQWLILGESIKQVLMLKRIPSGAYVCSMFVEQRKMFRFWIVGEDLTNQREIKGTSKILQPQIMVNETNVRYIAPEVEILDTDLGLVDFESVLTLAARVVAFPKPEVQWQNEASEIYASETILLEIPSVYISYVTISKVSQNFTISCQVNNDAGSTDKSIDIFVNRTFSFDVVQSPEDASVEFGSEHRLHCEVDAYPEATIKWYLNDTLIDTSTNARLAIEDNSLVIKEMGFEDIGTYECMASNDVESEEFDANVQITGVEVPEIETTETEIHFKPLEFSAEIECRVTKGKPAPEITWKYKPYNETEFNDFMPDGASNSSPEKITFVSVDKKHEGVYKCVARNAMGEDSRDFNVKIVSPPVIKNSEREIMSVRQGDNVRLPCDVEATPEATVRWEMAQDDVIITFDQRHWTDDKHTHHFRAISSDSGNYHCIAENSVGKAERTVILNVLVQPYIEPQPELFYANIGRSVTLPCNVLRGNPTPDMRWEFTPKDSTTSIKLSRDSSRSSLEIHTVSKSHEGAYLCIAENQFGSDSIKYNLEVQ